MICMCQYILKLKTALCESDNIHLSFIRAIKRSFGVGLMLLSNFTQLLLSKTFIYKVNVMEKG